MRQARGQQHGQQVDDGNVRFRKAQPAKNKPCARGSQQQPDGDRAVQGCREDILFIESAAFRGARSLTIHGFGFFLRVSRARG